MYVTSKYSGYNRHGEQSAAGRFLILMQPDWNSTKYPHQSNFCRKCGVYKDKHLTMDGSVQPCSEHGVVARLRKLQELRALEMTDEQRNEAVHACFSERYVDGCAGCEAWKSFTSVCREFQHSFNSYPMRGLVRYVRMKQLGHFMMGSAVVGKHRLTLSGSYGSDGLPKSVPDEVYEAGVEVPRDLYDAWNKGGGWNGCGNEADAMRKWALATFPRTKQQILRRLRGR